MDSILRTIYQKLIKPLAFKFDAEDVHVFTIRFGELLGNLPLSSKKYPPLYQKILDINFSSPIGLAAGFDYEGRLTQILPKIGFGFQTIGTITKNEYEGNAKPRLGRIPEKLALLVNKGFRNPGAEKIISKLSHKNFKIPVGISIGSEKGSISDIISAFKKFERSTVNPVYYELNISCPNLKTSNDFYKKNNLINLLTAIDKLKIIKPIFVKMPISKSNKEILSLLKIISQHCPAGVIIGNLYHSAEGNISGKPTFDRSNELINLAYQKYKNRFIIIGCGGVFSASDAYQKICAGATLVQMITGLIYRGPQLVSEINHDLEKILKENGFKNISDAIGKNVL